MKTVILIAFAIIGIWVLFKFLWPKGNFRPGPANNWRQGNPLATDLSTTISPHRRVVCLSMAAAWAGWINA